MSRLTRLAILLAPLLVLIFCNAEEIIEPPEVTSWGTWGYWENCTSPNFATGFQLKAQAWQGPVLDDSALNAIKLYCGNPINEDVVTGSVGEFGKWRNQYRCGAGEYITGFQLKVEKGSVIDFDETATNNARFYCAWNKTAFLEGDGENWGNWGQAVHCSSGSVVCGIRTQVQKPQGLLGDNTGLNNVKMSCCPL